MLSERKSQGEIGFQKLHKFNIALLRKQSWRLLTKPKSLIAKVLKTRYFPSCSVLDASLGSNPSYTRRSIHAWMDFLKKGVRWRVGTGSSITILDDPWLPCV